MEWKSTDLSCKLSLTCGGNINYYKSVRHPIPIRENREHPGNFQNKSVISHFNWVSGYILFLTKLNRKGRPFLEDARRGGHIVRLPSKAPGCHKRLKGLSFCEIWNNSTASFFLLDPLQIRTTGHGVLW